ncbi:MAG: magnesium ion transporter [Tremellales sp. Tagirdzhanova-0007]|nr:MAG: magnesium ion transporter [Tremellales sp. Tagirdzhanova-0007]
MLPIGTVILACPPKESKMPSSIIQFHTSIEQGPKKKEKKQRFLDNLMDKAGELSLRCSILDAEGNWHAEEGRYKKTELDLRKLDSLTPNLVPLILTRRTCILISMLHIRALIKPDRVVIFDTAGTVESEVQRRFKWHLERHVRAGLKIGAEESEEEGLSYEHRALESILVAAANALEEEMVFSRQLVQKLLADLEDDIDRDNLKRLLHYSRRMVGFQSRARYVKQAVDELLESDEDLSAMYLTSRAQGQTRALHDHEQLELLLESFAKQVEEIVSEVETTVANMNSTQEIAELMLDSGRNALLALDVKISIATLGVGSGALIAGMFGMNLATDLEQHPHAFLIVSGAASVLAIVIVAYGLKVFRRVRRVALSGNDTPSIGRLMSSQLRDPSAASHSSDADPLILRDKPFLESAGTPASRRKTAFWDRMFRRKARRASIGAEPVWINKQADSARARDAQQSYEHDAAHRTNQLQDVRWSGLKDMQTLQRAWRGGSDHWGPGWEAGAHKMRAKAKWG